MAGKFEPKVPVHLDPPKDDPISLEDLSKATGTSECPSMERIACGFISAINPLVRRKARSKRLRTVAF